MIVPAIRDNSEGLFNVVFNGDVTYSLPPLPPLPVICTSLIVAVPPKELIPYIDVRLRETIDPLYLPFNVVCTENAIPDIVRRPTEVSAWLDALPDMPNVTESSVVV